MGGGGEAAQTLKCNKWVLKVPIHCVGCKREIKKLLHSIDGVYTTSIDPEKQQVTVTGSIDSHILLKKLSKTGKYAEICAEKSAEKGKKNEKPNEPKTSQNNHPNTTTVSGQKKASSKPEIKTPAKNTNEKNKATEAGGTRESGNMKKSKGQKGNLVADGASKPLTTGSLNDGQMRKCKGSGIQVNLSPPLDSINANRGLPIVQVLSYNAAYPTKLDCGLSYQIASSSAQISYENSSNGEGERSCQLESMAFNGFDIFSDENANGCSIM